jgi:uncharacterized surface protein with fasciclin (FAS1) repeats
MSMMPTMMMTDLYDTVANNPDLSTLATLLKSAGLMKGMTMMANVTLLAPNNAAFAALSPAMIATLTNASNIGTSRHYHYARAMDVRCRLFLLTEPFTDTLSASLSHHRYA